MNASAVRQYQLHLGQPAPHVVRSGPADVLRVGVGKPLDDALALAGLLFPICPRAHQVAALRAAEQAVGVTLPPGQAAAREILLLTEGVYSAVWRAALSWAMVLGAAVPAQAVQAARGANDRVVGALYTGPWAHIGGAPLQPDPQALTSITEALAQSFDAVRPLGMAARDRAAGVTVSMPQSAALDGHVLEDAGEDRSDQVYEETPRTLLDPQSKATSLAPWFDGQLAYGGAMVAELRQQIAQLSPDGGGCVEPAMTGSGIGIAMTARGRLRHAMTLEKGVVTLWSAMAPTDWNFAAHGPAARAARGLGTANAANAALLVAAFDPCAPCDIVMESADA